MEQKLNKKQKERLDEVLTKRSMIYDIIYLIADVIIFTIVFLTSINLIKEISNNGTQIVLLMLLLLTLPRVMRYLGRAKLVYRNVTYK